MTQRQRQALDSGGGVQLPHPDIAHETRPPNLHSSLVLARMEWAYEQRGSLTGRERAILRDITYRAARADPRESLAEIVDVSGYSRSSVTRALRVLSDQRLITNKTQFRALTTYRPRWQVDVVPPDPHSSLVLARMEWAYEQRGSLTGRERAILRYIAFASTWQEVVKTTPFRATRAKIADVIGYGDRSVREGLRVLSDLRLLVANKNQFRAPASYRPRWPNTLADQGGKTEPARGQGGKTEPARGQGGETEPAERSQGGETEPAERSQGGKADPAFLEKRDPREEREEWSPPTPSPGARTRARRRRFPIIQALGESVDNRVIEALHQVSPGSWDASWAPVVVAQWEEVSARQDIRSPVGLLVYRLRQMMDYHDVSAPAPAGMDEAAQPVAATLSYASYF